MRFVVFVLLASVCFGTTGTAQALGPEADPLSVGAARVVIGGGALAIVAGVMAWVRRKRADTASARLLETGAAARWMPTWLIVAIGAAGVIAYQPAFFAGTAANGVAIGTVVALGSAPVLTGALDLALSRRRPSGRWLAATAIATSGVALLAMSGGSSDSSGSGVTNVASRADAATALDPLGLVASVGAGASYAVYTLAAKALLDRGWTPTGSMGALFGTAAACSVPLLVLTDAAWLATAPGLAMALWLGLVTTTLAYLLFGAGLRGLVPATVSTLTLAEPLTAAVLGVAVLGERLDALASLGLVVLAAGILVLAVPSPRRRTSRRNDVGGPRYVRGMDIILIPGFWLDATSWGRVSPELEAAGHRVHALTLPGLDSIATDRSGIGLRDHIDAVVDVVDSLPGQVVLVGHSGGGAIAHGVVDARPDRIARVVYVDSGPLGAGGVINDESPIVGADMPLPDWNEFGESELADLDEQLREAIRARAVPEPAGVATQKMVLSDDPRKYSVPITVVACSMPSALLQQFLADDHPFTRELARVDDVSWVDLPTGHWPQFTKPVQLGQVIAAAVD